MVPIKMCREGGLPLTVQVPVQVCLGVGMSVKEMYQSRDVREWACLFDRYQSGCVRVRARLSLMESY